MSDEEFMRRFREWEASLDPAMEEYLRADIPKYDELCALYLAAVSVLPEFMIAGFRVAPIPVIGPFLDSLLPTWITSGLGVTFYFGGTSLLIVVGVAMDTVNQIEAQLVMRHYEGFTPRAGRIRGRRSSAA